MTVGDALEAMGQWLADTRTTNRQYSDAARLQALKTAIIAAVGLYPEWLCLRTSQDINVTAESETFQLPADCREVVALYHGLTRLFPIDPTSELAKMMAGTGRPVYYAIAGVEDDSQAGTARQVVRLYPAPAEDCTINTHYRLNPAYNLQTTTILKLPDAALAPVIMIASGNLLTARGERERGAGLVSQGYQMLSSAATAEAGRFDKTRLLWWDA